MYSDIALGIMILVMALLYSSVGHAGASGYLAAMALMGVSTTVMRPTALTLNIFVATIATIKYLRAGRFSWKLFWPFAIASIPFAYLGGTLSLPGHIYKPLIGSVLLYVSWRSYHTADSIPRSTSLRPPAIVLISMGAALGFVSGLTGVGGGIFLSPVLLLFRWAEIKVISGISAAFILVNSIAGWLGVFSSASKLPSALPYWAVAAIVGGFIGAEYGSKRLGNATIQKLLALVLAIAGIKMILSGLGRIL